MLHTGQNTRHIDKVFLEEPFAAKHSSFAIAFVLGLLDEPFAAKHSSFAIAFVLGLLDEPFAAKHSSFTRHLWTKHEPYVNHGTFEINPSNPR
jgi:hypothetical protein